MTGAANAISIAIHPIASVSMTKKKVIKNKNAVTLLTPDTAELDFLRVG